MLEAAVTAPFVVPVSTASFTALCNWSTSSLTCVESLSIASFACWPASVFGLPRLFRSSANVLVADLISLVVFFRSPFVRLPLLSDSPAVLTEFDQVVIEEQRLSAQSCGDGEELLEEPPQPATSRAASAMGTSASFMRQLSQLPVGPASPSPY